MEPYLMTSRTGIYLNFNKKLIDGKFFGLTHQGSIWYVFGTHAEDIHVPSFQGYILQFEIDTNGNMINQKEVLTGLDNGVHQICVWRNHLYILETYIQRITILSLSDFTKIEIYPLDRAISRMYKQHGYEGSYEKYAHMNSITVQDDRFYVMCSNYSRIVMFSPNWKVLDTFDTGLYSCRDLVIIGHEIYFSDSTNTIFKLNIVTRKVEVCNVSNKISRGLSISGNDQVWLGTNNSVVDFINSQRIVPCCIKRMDGSDFNDETSHFKKSFTLTYPSQFNNSTLEVFNKLEEIDKHIETSKSNFENFEEFLNPDVSKLLENKISQNIEKKFSIPYYLIESDPLYICKEGHIIDWSRIIDDDDRSLLNYRMYIINTTGDSYFMYKHPFSNKIHAVKDIDGTCLIYNIEYRFVHAVICTKGSRLAYGVKFSEEVFDIMGMDNIWETKKKPFELIFPLPTNDHVCNIYENLFMNENEINTLRSLFNKLELREGVIGGVDPKFVPDYRRSKVAIVNKTWEFKELYLKIFQYVYKLNNDTYKFNLNEISENIHYTEYDESYQGKYDWHLDVGNGTSSKRKLSVVIQLSDPSEYEGGELQLSTGGNYKICSKIKGTLITFPPFLLHRVTPVTKGTRRSLVLWIAGPPFC